LESGVGARSKGSLLATKPSRMELGPTSGSPPSRKAQWSLLRPEQACAARIDLSPILIPKRNAMLQLESGLGLAARGASIALRATEPAPPASIPARNAHILHRCSASYAAFAPGGAGSIAEQWRRPRSGALPAVASRLMTRRNKPIPLRGSLGQRFGGPSPN
jgi:hypothetical protein